MIPQLDLVVSKKFEILSKYTLQTFVRFVKMFLLIEEFLYILVCPEY